jgi:hypothetical protein
LEQQHRIEGAAGVLLGVPVAALLIRWGAKAFSRNGEIEDRVVITALTFLLAASAVYALHDGLEAIAGSIESVALR